ncbi:SDR family oxidoreductase [Halocatena salina]|uniref:SDR family oxidoreductase n=1 Tax=Halocatena salina TaxID=2934340 RepID=A0A8U0A1P5_9EURY|nr:SDR family oxidoreductase [Halocatena salina]UPM42368.1 SDR family oxidoreductase [Halocatena salina]
MDKTVLITGCSSGVGRATATAFLEEEWTVYATARNTEDIESLADVGCETAPLDVTDEDSITAVVDRILDEQGQIDCLVNNAGYGQFGPVEDVPTELLDAQFDVNVYGPHRLVRAVLPSMREHGTGTIVNVSSVVGRVSVPGMGVYSASKHALEALSDALRSEVEDDGVAVSLVQAGPVSTEFADRADSELSKLDQSDTYDAVYTFYEDTEMFGGQSPVAVPPETVAETILEAGVSPNPDARYPAGSFGTLALKTRFLPDGVRDWVYRQLLRVL